MRDPTLMIFGASTRAAAQSAVRAGLRPICADHFADEDLAESASILPLDRYPQALVDIIDWTPRVPWMYTGALENWPSLIARLARRRTLLGNGADVVRAVRNPFRLQAVLRRADLPALEVRRLSAPPAADATWLLKPRRGSAGRGIRAWDERALWAAATTRGGEARYFQRRASGRPVSALFLASGAEPVMVGLMEQWIGREDLFAGAFSYCGSIGPIPTSPATEMLVRRTGRAVASAFGLRGLFGIDFILDGETAWMTEVNPRYTASVEVYERALGVPLLARHCQACQAADADEAGRIADELALAILAAQGRLDRRMGAKAVVFAPFAIRVPWLADLAKSPTFAGEGIEIADRPRPGSTVGQRAPVCSLLALTSADATFPRLCAALAELLACFRANRAGGD